MHTPNIPVHDGSEYYYDQILTVHVHTHKLVHTHLVPDSGIDTS